MTKREDEKRVPNCLCVYYLTHLTLDSGNGGWSEGNIVTRKRFTGPDGTQYPYWSGQCVRRMMRSYWEGNGENVSPVTKKGKVTTSACNPVDFIDDDLFGYMDEETARVSRTGPVRVSPLIGSFPFRPDDRDLGINSGESNNDNNIFETEQTYNAYYGCVLIELDRFGVFWQSEREVARDGALEGTAKKRRLEKLLDAIENLWGGGKQGRLLSNVSPQFMIATLQHGKNPFLLGVLKLDQKSQISNPESIPQLIEARRRHVSEVMVAYTPGIGNSSELAASIAEIGAESVVVGELAEKLSSITAKELSWLEED